MHMISAENQNVSLILTALQPLPVEMKNVLIPVIVHKMLIARHEIIGGYVIVELDLQAIHMAELALQVRHFYLNTLAIFKVNQYLSKDKDLFHKLLNTPLKYSV